MDNLAVTNIAGWIESELLWDQILQCFIDKAENLEYIYYIAPQK